MHGTVVDGEGRARGFVPTIEADVLEVAGFRPYPGTLNLRDLEGVDGLSAVRLDDPAAALDNCDGVDVRPCAISGVRGAILTPLVPDYPGWKSEVVAPIHLRSLFGLRDGDAIAVSAPDELWHPDGAGVEGRSLDAFDGVVFDLDGTLVDLAVDWGQVREELRGLFENDPFDRPGDRPLDEYARACGVYDAFSALLRDFEVAGATEASPHGLLGLLEELDCPIGICTKNATKAAETALEEAGMAGAVDAIVGRETTAEEKPHPRPLVVCLDRLGVEAGRAVFVGNEQTDCRTARRAGTSFLHRRQIAITG